MALSRRAIVVRAVTNPAPTTAVGLALLAAARQVKS